MASPSGGAAISLGTHDVILRGLRVRVGDDPNGPEAGNRDGIRTDGSANNLQYSIVIDHCSISWAIDGDLDLSWAHDVTVSNCILSETLWHSLHPKGEHSRAMLLSKNNPNPSRFSIVKNLFAHNDERNPEISNSDALVVDNLVYNWGKSGTVSAGSSDVIGNVYISGTNTHGWSENPNAKGVRLNLDKTGTTGNPVKLYVHDNIGPFRTTNQGDDWLVVEGDTIYRSFSRLTDQDDGITVLPVESVYDYVLANAGATAPYRDAVDTRIIQEVKNHTGHIIDSQNEVGGWPVMNAGTPPADTDHDGMPDSWETSHGLNPTSASDGPLDRDGDGYTNVEEYINGLTGGTIVSVEDGNPILGVQLVLAQNYPNPFNPTTRIEFRVPSFGFVRLKIFDVLGREVATLVNGELSAGEHSVVFDATGLPSGVYFYRLTTPTFSQTRIMEILK